MRGLWQRSTARVPAAKLSADSDTRELLAAAVPEGPYEGVSGRSQVAGLGEKWPLKGFGPQLGREY